VHLLRLKLWKLASTLCKHKKQVLFSNSGAAFLRMESFEWVDATIIPGHPVLAQCSCQEQARPSKGNQNTFVQCREQKTKRRMSKSKNSPVRLLQNPFEMRMASPQEHWRRSGDAKGNVLPVDADPIQSDSDDDQQLRSASLQRSHVVKRENSAERTGEKRKSACDGALEDSFVNKKGKRGLTLPQKRKRRGNGKDAKSTSGRKREKTDEKFGKGQLSMETFYEKKKKGKSRDSVVIDLLDDNDEEEWKEKLVKESDGSASSRPPSPHIDLDLEDSELEIVEKGSCTKLNAPTTWKLSVQSLPSTSDSSMSPVKSLPVRKSPSSPASAWPLNNMSRKDKVMIDDDDSLSSTSISPTKKQVSRRRLPSISSFGEEEIGTIQDQLLTEVVAPKTEKELIDAHTSKKITEVKYWMQEALRASSFRPILFLHGPSGIGKSVTVKVLAKEMQVSVREWKSEVDLVGTFSKDHFSENAWRPHISQLDDFASFVRSTRYTPLPLTEKRSEVNRQSFVLINALPFLHGEEKREQFKLILHETLLNASLPRKQPVVPVVIVYSCEGESTNLNNAIKEYSREIIMGKNTRRIEMKRVPNSRMSKVLRRICESQELDVSDKILQEILLNSDGDIRHAVNLLHFETLGGTTRRKEPSNHSKRRKRSPKARHTVRAIERQVENLENSEDGQGRDANLSILRTVGKLLRAKTIGEKLAAEMQKRNTVPLKNFTEAEKRCLTFDPDLVAGNSAVEPDVLLDFIHHNCLVQIAELKDAANVLDALSFAENLSSSGSKMGVSSWVSRRLGKDFPGAYVNAISSRAMAAFCAKRNKARFGQHSVQKPRHSELRNQQKQIHDLWSREFSGAPFHTLSRSVQSDYACYVTIGDENVDEVPSQRSPQPVLQEDDIESI